MKLANTVVSVLKPSPGRDFECLGVTSGVLHLFSALYQTRGDGGELFGIEPVTGAVIYHKVFASDRYSIPPIVSALQKPGMAR